MTLVGDMRRIEKGLVDLAAQVEANRKMIEQGGKTVALHEQQISGERGLSVAMVNLSGEVKGLRRAAYWVAGTISAGAITFAFSVLSLAGGG